MGNYPIWLFEESEKYKKHDKKYYSVDIIQTVNVNKVKGNYPIWLFEESEKYKKHDKKYYSGDIIQTVNINKVKKKGKGKGKGRGKGCKKVKKKAKEKEHECKNIINVNVNCCDHKKEDIQVNKSADDVANFPRITQSETSLAYFKNRILYGYNEFNTSNNNNISGFSFSSDLGKSWTDGGTIPLNPGGSNDGDPVIAVDKKGIFYYGQIGTEVIANNLEGVISVSTGIINPNNTITMNQPQVIGRGQNPSPNGSSQDKEWIAVGPDRNSPGDEALYVAWRDLTDNNSIRFSSIEQDRI